MGDAVAEILRGERDPLGKFFLAFLQGQSRITLCFFRLLYQNVLEQDWRDSTKSEALVLHVAEPDLFPGTAYGSSTSARSGLPERRARSKPCAARCGQNHKNILVEFQLTYLLRISPN